MQDGIEEQIDAEIQQEGDSHNQKKCMKNRAAKCRLILPAAADGEHGAGTETQPDENRCEETTASASCPYCGSPVVLKGKLSGMLKPDYIIPFKLDKKQAKEALKRPMRGSAEVRKKHFAIR